MPNNTINIKVSGVVLFCQKMGITRLIFPIDADCHRVAFTHQKQGESPSAVTNLAQPGREIQVATQDAVSTTGVSNDINQFIDLTADYSHDSGIEMKTGWQDKAVVVTIENAYVSLGELSARKFILLEDNVIRRKAEKIGNSFNADITLSSNGRVSIFYEEMNQDFSVFESEAGSNYTLTFDNDCAMLPPTARNDFDMYYDLIEDAFSRRKFKLIGLKPESGYNESDVDEEVDSSVFNEPLNENAESDFPCKPAWISNC